MKKNYLFLLFCMLGSSILTSYAQQQKVEDEYYSYFKLPREGLYLHLNKTSFFTGEEIWFKGYTYDQRNLISSKATTNINIGIYDAAGNQVKKGLFAAEHGVAQGNFAVDSTLTAGTYYIKAETNWMKNFKENDAFIQKIEIFTDQEIQKKNPTKKAQFDFQFLPEGGHLVANTDNNIGFKVIDNNGKGMAATGIVYDQEKKQVASFESNTLGMGKFLLQPKKNTLYTAEIILENGTKISKNLSQANTKGVSLMMKHTTNDKVILEFNTNEETLASHPEATYKILIHQSGKLKIASLKFSNLKKVVTIEKKALFKGVNTITVFDSEKRPIIERLFFNDYFLKKPSINVTKTTTVKDSMVFSVNESQLHDNIHLSISVLPETTIGYKPTHSIASYFYLKPHLKGAVENPQYYFKNIGRKKKYELDLLLLTQGWSRYDWKDIFGQKPLRRHRFENGITIHGTVNRPTKNVDRLFLYATKNHAAQFIDLDENQKFSLANLFLEEGEEIRFSYMNKKGIFKKPSVYLRFTVADGKDEITIDALPEKDHASVVTSFTIPENFVIEDAQELEKVVIKVKKEKEERDPVFFNAKITKVTKEIYERYFNVTDFIQNNGFDVYENMGEVFITTRRRFITNLDTQETTQPVVFYDGVRLTDFSILYGMSTANVEKIVIDRTGLGLGSIGSFAGVIKIFSRRTPLFEKGPGEIMYTATTAPKAFAPIKKYYAPKYASYSSSTFEKYGAISWIPDITLQKSNIANFKIYDTGTQNITLFIEGISESGHLISERRTLKVR